MLEWSSRAAPSELYNNLDSDSIPARGFPRVEKIAVACRKNKSFRWRYLEFWYLLFIVKPFWNSLERCQVWFQNAKPIDLTCLSCSANFLNGKQVSNPFQEYRVDSFLSNKQGLGGVPFPCGHHGKEKWKSENESNKRTKAANRYLLSKAMQSGIPCQAKASTEGNIILHSFCLLICVTRA